MKNYRAVWKVLEELTTTLKKNGVDIFPETIEELRSSRAMINIYNADPTYEDTVQPIESYLGDLEVKLMTLAQKEMGEDFVNEWLRRIFEARQKDQKKEEVTRGFIPGVPRSDYWIRVRIGDTIASEELRQKAANQGLSTRDEGAEFVIVHGERSKVKQLIREIAKKMRKRKKRT